VKVKVIVHFYVQYCNLHLMLILKTAGQQLERWRDGILCLPLLFNYSLLYHK
jgi:hypothetical protein